MIENRRNTCPGGDYILTAQSRLLRYSHVAHCRTDPGQRGWVNTTMDIFFMAFDIFLGEPALTEC